MSDLPTSRLIPKRLPPRLPASASAPPLLAGPPLITADRRPRVVLWYRLWCALFVVFYLGFCVSEILIARGTIEPNFGLIEDFASRNDKALRGRLIAEKRADAPGFAASTFCIALVYAAAAAIPRKPWAWVFGIVALATTIFPFVVTAGGTVPILVHWARPEVKQYFGRRT